MWDQHGPNISFWQTALIPESDNGEQYIVVFLVVRLCVFQCKLVYYDYGVAVLLSLLSSSSPDSHQLDNIHKMMMPQNVYAKQFE